MEGLDSVSAIAPMTAVDEVPPFAIHASSANLNTSLYVVALNFCPERRVLMAELNCASQNPNTILAQWQDWNGLGPGQMMSINFLPNAEGLPVIFSAMAFLKASSSLGP